MNTKFKIGFMINDTFYQVGDKINLFLRESFTLKNLGIDKSYKKVEIVNFDNWGLTFRDAEGVYISILPMDIVNMYKS